MSELIKNIRPNKSNENLKGDYKFFRNFQNMLFKEHGGYSLDKLNPTANSWYYNKPTDERVILLPYTHQYYLEYADRFKEKRESAKKFLEIGVFTGFSMLMWEKFFTQAIIYGIDINIERTYYLNKNPYELCKEFDRIKLFEFDATKKERVEEWIRRVFSPIKNGGEFDIIIDDASHIPDHQIRSFFYFFPYLKRDGIYVVEDIGLYPTGGVSYWINNKRKMYMEDFKDCEVGIEYGGSDLDYYKIEYGIPIFEYFMKNYRALYQTKNSKYMKYLTPENIKILDSVNMEWVEPKNYEHILTDANLKGDTKTFQIKGNSLMCFINYKN